MMLIKQPPESVGEKRVQTGGHLLARCAAGVAAVLVGGWRLHGQFSPSSRISKRAFLLHRAHHRRQLELNFANKLMNVYGF